MLPEIPSPCIGVCRLDAASGMCIGCLRTLDEIARWGSMSTEERVRLMRELRKRRAEARLSD